MTIKFVKKMVIKEYYLFLNNVLEVLMQSKYILVNLFGPFDSSPFKLKN